MPPLHSIFLFISTFPYISKVTQLTSGTESILQARLLNSSATIRLCNNHSSYSQAHLPGPLVSYLSPLCLLFLLSFCHLQSAVSFAKMRPKGKTIVEVSNPLIQPQIDFHHTPLVDKDCKIIETSSQFDLFEIYCWWEEQLIDQSDEIGLWES